MTDDPLNPTDRPWMPDSAGASPPEPKPVEPDRKDRDEPDDVEWHPPHPDVRTPSTVADEVRGKAETGLGPLGDSPGR